MLQTRLPSQGPDVKLPMATRTAGIVSLFRLTEDQVSIISKLQGLAGLKINEEQPGFGVYS